MVDCWLVAWHCATALGGGTMRQEQFAAECCHVISNIFTVCVCVCVCVYVSAAFHPKLSQYVPKDRNFSCSPFSPLKLFPISLFLRHAQLRSNTLCTLSILLQWKFRDCFTPSITNSNVLNASVYLIAQRKPEVGNNSVIKPGTVRTKQRLSISNVDDRIQKT